METAVSSSSLSTIDPTSLRATALSTLKSKRRRVGTVETPAAIPMRRPVPSKDLITLDYGQDEASSSSAPAQSRDEESSFTMPELKKAPSREEGEISDEEDDTTIIPPRTPSPRHSPPRPPPEMRLPTHGVDQSSPLQESSQPTRRPSLLERMSVDPSEMPQPAAQIFAAPHQIRPGVFRTFLVQLRFIDLTLPG